MDFDDFKDKIILVSVFTDGPKATSYISSYQLQVLSVTIAANAVINWSRCCYKPNKVS